MEGVHVRVNREVEALVRRLAEVMGFESAAIRNVALAIGLRTLAALYADWGDAFAESITDEYFLERLREAREAVEKAVERFERRSKAGVVHV